MPLHVCEVLSLVKTLLSCAFWANSWIHRTLFTIPSHILPTWVCGIFPAVTKTMKAAVAHFQEFRVPAADAQVRSAVYRTVSRCKSKVLLRLAPQVRLVLSFVLCTLYIGIFSNCVCVCFFSSSHRQYRPYSYGGGGTASLAVFSVLARTF